VDANVILIAEDDANDRFLIKRALDRGTTGLNAVFVNDGEEAIEYLDGAPPFNDREKYPLPAVLLVDIKMPRRNGFDVLAWVRAHANWHRLPVVMLSSSSLDRDVQRAYDLMANNYLTKPGNYTLLASALDELCRYWFQRSQLPRCGPDIRPEWPTLPPA
jgi:CheY-like chemotaxis protein